MHHSQKKLLNKLEHCEDNKKNHFFHTNVEAYNSKKIYYSTFAVTLDKFEHIWNLNKIFCYSFKLGYF